MRLLNDSNEIRGALKINYQIFHEHEQLLKGHYVLLGFATVKAYELRQKDFFDNNERYNLEQFGYHASITLEEMNANSHKLTPHDIYVGLKRQVIKQYGW